MSNSGSVHSLFSAQPKDHILGSDILGSATESDLDDRGTTLQRLPPELIYGVEKDKLVLKVDFGDIKSRRKVMKRISGIKGVTSVSMDPEEGTVAIVGFLDVQEVVQTLRKRWAIEILSGEQSHKEDQKGVLEGGPSVRGAPTSEKSFAGKSIMTPLNVRNRDDDWHSFQKFLNSSGGGLTLTGCRVEDVIEFLRIQQSSGNIEALVSHLSAGCEAYGIKPKNNPFNNLAVKKYVREAKKMNLEPDCVLVVSCNDNFYASCFIQAILQELHKQEAIPLTYNLSGREKLDTEMIYRCSAIIIVISDGLARNSQSMDHLVAIMEHWKAKHLVIVPVYFNVNISGTRLEGWFKAVLLQCSDSIDAERFQKWKAVMIELASIEGHQCNGRQFMFAKKVVGNTCLKLYLKNSRNMVKILALLNHSQPSDADIVGIWGMAGIGKTATAREVYEILASQYDLCYFQKDFDQKCQENGLRQMRDDFFSKVFGEEKLSISACDINPRIMRNWFHNKTILVVLDDVSNAGDVETVVGGFGWFSRGHRIILTSRRKQVLVQCKVQEPYEMQKLCETESLMLCKRYLNEERVISELMSRSSGIPLALEVLATSVLDQHHIKDMVTRLLILRICPPNELQETFQKSFKRLDENEKNIFFDLACFFRREKMDHVVQLLDACGFRTYLGIYGLMDESLISLVDNRIEMPIPFQDIGQFIVRYEDQNPSERSRLWDSKDIIDVFTNSSGTDATEGIFLDMSDLTCELSPIVFCEMYRLRLLKFYCSTSGKECKLSLPEGLDSLPDELRLLHWENYPLEYLPQKFNPKNLVELNMPYSNMEKLWGGKKNLEKLKKITLSHSKSLTDIQMLSEAQNLEHIDLEGCTSLVDVSTSIPCCGKLVSLNMKDCLRLQRVPAMVNLTSLKLLNLSGCSELQEIQNLAPNLEELYLAGTAITELPLSIGNLTELVTLDLENCERLQQLPFGIKNSRSIVDLKLSGCTSLESLPKPMALD